MNEQLNNTLSAEPTHSQERIEVLDVIRGIALLGILLVHMPIHFGTPFLYLALLEQVPEWTNIWDKVADTFVKTFIQGKFYPIFSFLFGLGFFIFFERAKERTDKPKRLFYRRLFILLIIGLLHAFFIWSGDVLVSYALFGFLLPLFFNLKPKAILHWAIGLFAPLVFFTVLGALISLAVGAVTETPSPFAFLEGRIESSYQTFGSGTFSEIMTHRAVDTLLALSFALFGVLLILPIFLVGLYVGKIGFFQHLESNLHIIKKAWLYSLILALPMSILSILLTESQANASLLLFVNFLRDVGLIFFYITSIILLFQKKNWAAKLKPLGYVGRMALSNYLLQSIICTMIFYSYGLGLYGKMNPAIGFVVAIAIFILQIFISKWWLARYQFGPVEWLWKILTYGKRFKMRN